MNDMTPEQLEAGNDWLESTTPCIECATPVATDVHAEELGYCLDCSNAYFDHSDEEKACGHLMAECPNHEGNFDCNPFCRLCEGNQEYCPDCEDETQAQIDKFLDTPTRVEAWLCPDCTTVAGQKYDPNLTDDYDPQTDDGYTAFSKTPCFICLSPLHGERYRFAQWTNDNNKETN
jgi:hypothetical protein